MLGRGGLGCVRERWTRVCEGEVDSDVLGRGGLGCVTLQIDWGKLHSSPQEKTKKSRDNRIEEVYIK